MICYASFYSIGKIVAVVYFLSNFISKGDQIWIIYHWESIRVFSCKFNDLPFGIAVYKVLFFCSQLYQERLQCHARIK